MENFYDDVAGDVKERFNMSGFTQNRHLPMGEHKKVIGLMKNELEEKIMTEVVALRPKSYAYRKLDNMENKGCKRIKKCVMKNTISLNSL